MSQTSMELLTLTSEAAVLVHAGRAVYLNSAARSILGADCEGKRVAELFGDDVDGTQASTFLAQIRIHGLPYALRATRFDGDRLFFLRPQEPLPAVLNQPFLYALRSALMNMSISLKQLRERAEALQDPLLLENLRALTREQYRLLRLIQNTSLILGDAEGEPVCAVQPFDLSGLYASILDAVQDLIPYVRIQARLGQSIPICADPALMKSLLLNLLSNALIHGRGLSRISVTLTDAAQSVVLAVDDDGCGIPPDALYRVFDRYRHSFELREMSTGPGLGLTAARLITQLHHGTLLLESRPGQGTTLRASLSKAGLGQLRLQAAENHLVCETGDILTGLADCLPPDCFREQYLD